MRGKVIECNNHLTITKLAKSILPLWLILHMTFTCDDQKLWYIVISLPLLYQDLIVNFLL